ncbi:MAG: Sir2 family NAD-dependent protein deacetylase [Crocinitomicaceae bacterium]|nr:Sir2 family NAD-dependent protein deacetylase [Crocinitomicaceae bacterium]
MKHQIIIFSGAGMSAESGIKTFRDSNGLWENYDINEVATPEAWEANPDLVSKFYNQRRKQIIESTPNEAHYAIAEMQKLADVRVITQNVDDLHERAGSENVMHLHGNIRYAKSSGPNQEKEYYPIQGECLTKNDTCPEGFRLRPHVVWFGEAVPMMEKAVEMIMEATHFVVIGSSLQVYPAANLLGYCPTNAKKWIIDPKANDMENPYEFTLINQKAVEGINTLVKQLKL